MSKKQERRSAEAKGRGDDFRQLYEQKEEQQVELIEWILQDRNIDEAIKAVKRNKGAAGVDGMSLTHISVKTVWDVSTDRSVIRERKTSV